MNLIEVNTPALARDFIKVNVLINQNDPNYIRPLDKDINEVFDKEKNKTFRSGEAIRWILQDSQGQLIGRIAAFVNRKYKTKGDEGPVGGMGFFDCINNQAAADILLDAAKNWLAERGMTAMDGPINFGERDTWWGLLVKGFEPPLYRMNYNPAYYKDLLENYGFRPFLTRYVLDLMWAAGYRKNFMSDMRLWLKTLTTPPTILKPITCPNMPKTLPLLIIKPGPGMAD
ncbi:hypothetical protein LWM68_06355 [Niabella sp. W65]|nr:hypothetical protein [Niabella sp. W65]MCH7362418.1 hypothetical protein [Niabella sp. W65]ULT38382.1 hypothetical protein KRR40_24990 [Niabella sp. I65]